MASLRSPAPTVAQLRTLLDSLHSSLDPVLSSDLSYLTSQLASRTNSGNTSGSSSSPSTSRGQHGKLDAGRLQTSLAYVLLDLVWILFKLNGTDASRHPVLVELERVKGYFTKFQSAERAQDGGDSGATSQERAGRESGQGRMMSSGDQAKVERFVTHALGKGKGEIMGKLIRFDDDDEKEGNESEQRIAAAEKEEDEKKRQEWESIKEGVAQEQGTKRKSSGGSKAPADDKKIKKKKTSVMGSEQGESAAAKQNKARKSSGGSAR